MAAPEFILTNARIWTGDTSKPWAEAFSAAGGIITAVGTSAEIAALAGPATKIEDAGGRLVMPGLNDVHCHLHLGGGMVAFEIPIMPTDSVDTIVAKIRERAATLGPDEWVLGGIVGSTVLDSAAKENRIKDLDEAAGGRPVLLKDDSQHNRWVNSRALELMGVDEKTPDPEGGTFVKDKDGKLTGVCYEHATGVAETAFRKSIPDKPARTKEAVATAVKVLNSYGITTVQEALTALGPAVALSELDREGKLNARVVGCSMIRPFIEEGIYGVPLLDEMKELATERFMPTFTKLFMDGVPLTKTAAMLAPYRCSCHKAAYDGHGDERDIKGEPYWSMDDLVAHLNLCYDRNLGCKMHATGDGAVRHVLDAVEKVRKARGPGPIFQVAHAEYIADVDIVRFKELQVVPDFSPYLWFPNTIQEVMITCIYEDVFNSAWPARALTDAGAPVACGSDWPCSAPTPDPWTGLAALVTRANPDQEAFKGTLNQSQALTLEEAVATFTRNPAEAMGLGDVAGQIKVGYKADAIVLDRNIFEVDISEVWKTKVLKTWFEGRLVHEA
ncbi:putative TIM-barrel fold metal-dependent hydrolase [Hyaloraphidium curvatum]|nr:putative TIM-barrel fold metal-dependent hydrolase [Hyaloraphidium curvatum]